MQNCVLPQVGNQNENAHPHGLHLSGSINKEVEYVLYVVYFVLWMV